LFGQTFEPHDIIVIAFLVLLEGVLSIDNALVLGLLARRVPKRLRPRALSYGLIGALVFRIVAIIAAGWLLHWRFPKLIGGLYLLYVAIKHFISPEKEHVEESLEQTAHESLDEDIGEMQRMTTHSKLFWNAVIAIELTDIAFAVDSIVAAIAMVSSGPHPGHRFHPKLWLVVIGGMLGVVAMRFAAAIFIKLLDKFPRFEISAYLLVLVIGGKLVLDYFFNDTHVRLDFHDVKDPAFWCFWMTMLACFCIGFIKPRVNPHEVLGNPGKTG
jgi:YkoY family integral membrane protein